MFCKEMQSRPVQFIVMEQKPLLANRLNRDGCLYVVGDAKYDES